MKKGGPPMGGPPFSFSTIYEVQLDLAYSTMPCQSTTTTFSSPTTQASWPEGSRETSPGLQSNSWPSSILTLRTPEIWYWKWGASQLLVFMRGWTDSDQRQPGSKTARPMDTPPTLRISNRPFG